MELLLIILVLIIVILTFLLLKKERVFGINTEDNSEKDKVKIIESKDYRENLYDLLNYIPEAVLILDKSSKKELLEVKDFRTSAISQGSSRILKELSIWNKIKKKAQPINEIYVSEGINSN